MSTTLVSAFYDFNDVIQQQSKQRPAMLDLRQRPLEQRKPSNLLISRRHSTNSTNMSSLASPSFTKTNPLSPSSSSFFPMPSSPKDPFLNGTSTLATQLNIRDRAQSASFQEELDAQHRKRNATNSSRYKTELCRPFEENGTCKYGDKCQFAHGFHELRGLNRHPKYKTEFCRTYHTIGFCPYGPRCHFIHNDEEKRLAQSSTSGRSVSMSSMDSTPSSPVIDIAPSPFSNTPPTSPGFGDVFVFDETPTTTHVPAPLQTKTSLASMSTIPETSTHQFAPQTLTRSISVSSALVPKSPSPNLTTISSMISDETRDVNTFQPIQMKIDERNTILTPPDSGSSNPPSPTDSLDGARRRLPVFGLMNQ